MKKFTGILFIVAALLLLGSSLTPISESLSDTNISINVPKKIEDTQELTKTISSIKRLADDLPRLI